MSKALTIKENRDFQRLYRRGKSFVSPVVVTYVMKSKGNDIYYGITTGKKVGNAVRRSRARRVIRAAFREVFPQLKTGCDIIFVARGKTPYVKSGVVAQAMRDHFSQAGIL
jgi:ribonuclease P protein component